MLTLNDIFDQNKILNIYINNIITFKKSVLCICSNKT